VRRAGSFAQSVVKAVSGGAKTMARNEEKAQLMLNRQHAVLNCPNAPDWRLKSPAAPRPLGPLALLRAGLRCTNKPVSYARQCHAAFARAPLVYNRQPGVLYKLLTLRHQICLMAN
jgi:hypothetical protein